MVASIWCGPPRPHSSAASLFMGPGVKLVKYEEISNNQKKKKKTKTWKYKDGACRGNSPQQRAEGHKASINRLWETGPQLGRSA